MEGGKLHPCYTLVEVILLTFEALSSQLHSVLDTLSDSRDWSCFLSWQLFWLSWLSTKHLDSLAWPKDAISVNQLEEIGMAPTIPYLTLQRIICACMLQIPAAAYSPVGSHNGPPAWRGWESWNMGLPTWFMQMFCIICSTNWKLLQGQTHLYLLFPFCLYR